MKTEITSNMHYVIEVLKLHGSQYIHVFKNEVSTTFLSPINAMACFEDLSKTFDCHIEKGKGFQIFQGVYKNCYCLTIDTISLRSKHV